MSWVLVALASIASMKAAMERGDLTEAARQGALAGPTVVERALASPDRMVRLAAIAAAPLTEDRAELLAPLARAAAGPDRRTAIPAALAAAAIAHDLMQHERPDDIAPDDIATWRATFSQLALQTDRWIELRLAALETAAELDPAGTRIDLAVALADPDPAFRKHAASLVALPLPDAAIAPLASTVVKDVDADVARAAAQALCADPTKPILDALGEPGLARIRTLGGDTKRCLTKR